LRQRRYGGSLADFPLRSSIEAQSRVLSSSRHLPSLLYGLPKLFELRLQGLALCGHPCISNVHGTNLTGNYGTFKLLIYWILFV
jgi:hypothetical protein